MIFGDQCSKNFENFSVRLIGFRYIKSPLMRANATNHRLQMERSGICSPRAFALLGLDYFPHDWISIIFPSGSRKYTSVRIPTFSIFFSVTSHNNSAPLLKAMFKVVSTFSTSNAIWVKPVWFAIMEVHSCVSSYVKISKVGPLSP